MKNMYIILCFITGVFLCASCSKMEPEEQLQTNLTVRFSTTTGEYRVKVGKTIRIEAVVENAENPTCSWTLDGKIISRELSFTYSGDKIGEYFPVLRVDADNGTVEEQIKISVLQKMPPIIFSLGNNGTVNTFTGVKTKISPEFDYTDESTTYKWEMNGEIVCMEAEYTITKDVAKDYHIKLTVTNEDGETVGNVVVKVIEKEAAFVLFDAGRYYIPGDKTVRRMSVPLGKNLVISPVVFGAENPTFSWSIDGQVQTGATSEFFNFFPTEKKIYLVKVTMTDGTVVSTAAINIECVAEEGAYFRPKTTSSTKLATTAFEFTPAPGQFVAFQKGSTAEQARAGIQASLDAQITSSFIASLGAWGGYMIVGFDHSIENKGLGDDQADIYWSGNAFGGWSEPGIVWVMQDENGNGKPDDTWYELAGSETGKPSTIQQYAVRYYKPKAAKMNVQWLDKYFNTGTVDYNSFHGQDYYFPMFIEGDSYIMTGTSLRSTFKSDGLETTVGFDWGYVDNMGRRVGMRISDAMHQDGTPANLKYIDFVKVHTGMMAKGSAVGEISTEACIPIDANFDKY